MTKLLFGCGYLGSRVANRWRAAGDDVVVVTRTRERADQLTRAEFTTLVADVTQPESLRDLPSAQTVVFAVGFDRSAVANGPSIEQVYAGGIRNVLTALRNDVGRFIYISTTGVYGPGNGNWVDETTTPDPQRPGGCASLNAEQQLREHPTRARGAILRMAGIYGPGRVPFLGLLRAGDPLPAPAQGYLNLIHVDDAAAAVIAAEQRAPIENSPRVYCVSDGAPVVRRDFYHEVARQIGASPPQFSEPDPHSSRAARAMSNRRISNARMLAELRVTLMYPDFKAGLTAVLNSSAATCVIHPS